MSEPLLYVSNLSVRYSERREVTTALGDVSFSLGKEIVTIIGPSGSGKSSLLHALAGIIRPRKGTLQLSGVPLSPRTHQIALVPQQYGLFPWKTVRESIHLPAALGKRIVSSDLQEEILTTLSLTDLLDRYPSELSGGQCQRCSPCSCLHHEAGPASSRRSILSPRCSDSKSLSSALPRAVAALSYTHPLRHP